MRGILLKLELQQFFEDCSRSQWTWTEKKTETFEVNQGNDENNVEMHILTPYN